MRRKDIENEIPPATPEQKDKAPKKAQTKPDKQPKKRQNTPKFSNELTPQQEIFVNELIKGSTQRQAYLKAYPNKRNWKENSLDVNASTMMKQTKVKLRYEELLNKARAEEQEKTLWTREQSISTLRYVIDKNQEDLNRINQAYNDEVDALLKAITENPTEAVTLTKALLQSRKARRISGVHNGGIVAAVAELNKMQGFTEENINLNGSVVFSGETQLED